jgi:hypothetical protein
MSRLVDHPFDKRLLILGLAQLPFVWGLISFHEVRIERGRRHDSRPR